MTKMTRDNILEGPRERNGTETWNVWFSTAGGPKLFSGASFSTTRSMSTRNNATAPTLDGLRYQTPSASAEYLMRTNFFVLEQTSGNYLTERVRSICDKGQWQSAMTGLVGKVSLLVCQAYAALKGRNFNKVSSFQASAIGGTQNSRRVFALTGR